MSKLESQIEIFEKWWNDKEFVHLTEKGKCIEAFQLGILVGKDSIKDTESDKPKKNLDLIGKDVGTCEGCSLEDDPYCEGYNC